MRREINIPAYSFNGKCSKGNLLFSSTAATRESNFCNRKVAFDIRLSLLTLFTDEISFFLIVVDLARLENLKNITFRFHLSCTAYYGINSDCEDIVYPVKIRSTGILRNPRVTIWKCFCYLLSIATLYVQSRLEGYGRCGNCCSATARLRFARIHIHAGVHRSVQVGPRKENSTVDRAGISESVKTADYLSVARPRGNCMRLQFFSCRENCASDKIIQRKIRIT